MKRTHHFSLTQPWNEQPYQQQQASAAVPPVPSQELPPVPNQPVPDPRVAAMERDLTAQRGIIQQLQTQIARPPAPAQQLNNVPDATQQRTQFFADPVTSAQAIARQAAQEVVNQYGAGHQETLIDAARSQVRTGNEEFFDRYANEIEAHVRQAGPQFQANINVWRSALNMVRGEHMREIVDAARQAQPGSQAPAIHISREGGPAAPNVPGTPAAQAAELSGEEKEMARKLGIDDDMYRAGKVLNDKQHSDLKPLEKSSWDKVVTFNSRDKARETRRNARTRTAA